MSDPVVQTRNLTKRYGDFTALDDLSISLHRGQILGFIGPNGAGKTTTIKILVGLARPTSGSARIADADCTTDAARIKHLVGYMPDTFGGYDHMRVHEYLDFFAAAYKIPAKQRPARIGSALELVGAEHMRDLYLQALSHGMKQRVALTRTLLHDPEVLILDEPANGLDPQARIDMRGVLLQLAARGKTLIVTSHILPELGRICDTVAILTKGRLRAFGSLEDIMRGLSQRRVMQVQLVSPDAVPRAASLLEDNLAPGDEVTPSPAEAEVRFTTTADDARLADLLSLLIGSGVAIAQWREVPLDLEDAFLSVTAGERSHAEPRSRGEEEKDEEDEEGVVRADP